MSEQIRMIAARIRELREISGLSIEELAKKLNISKEQYEKYESGEFDLPMSFLYNVASYFNIELTVILTGENPRLHTWCLVRNGKGVSVERQKQYKYQNLAFNFAHKKAEPFLVTVEPEPEEAPVHYNSHPGQEFNYVLEGKLKIFINNQELVLNEGDSLYFDSNAKHGMKAMDGKVAKFLAIII